MGNFKHSGCLGDIIYSLPAIRYLGGGNLYLVPDAYTFVKEPLTGLKAGLTLASIEEIKVLLERQNYINRVEVWANQSIDYDLDIFRSHPGMQKRLNLCEFILSCQKVPFSATFTPWLTCEKIHVANYVFGRSLRYNNPKVIPFLKRFLSKNNKDSIFIGRKHELDKFKKEIGEIEYYDSNDLYELCCVVNGCQRFVGNQSFFMAVAIALQKSYIQEVYGGIADCMFPRSNAYHIIGDRLAWKMKIL